MKTRRVGRMFAAALLASCAFAVLPSEPARAETVLGGLPHLDQYCQSLGYWNVVLEQFDAYGWKCTRATERAGMYMTAACVWTYQVPGAVAGYRNYSDPYSWYCYVP
jgi:hypothetical protein